MVGGELIFADNIELRPHVHTIGKPTWRPDLQTWVVLANVCGALALVAVKLTAHLPQGDVELIGKSTVAEKGESDSE